MMSSPFRKRLFHYLLRLNRTLAASYGAWCTWPRIIGNEYGGVEFRLVLKKARFGAA